MSSPIGSILFINLLSLIYETSTRESFVMEGG